MKRRPATKGVCRWCDAPILGGGGKPTGGTWHADCVQAFKLIHWPAETRRSVFERDRGVCARCGVDSGAQKRGWLATERLWCWLARRHYEHEVNSGRLKIAAWGEIHTLVNRDVASQLKARNMRICGAPWQHDHIRPLVEAKGDLSFWQLSNICTLCTSCHNKKTAQEAANRAAARRARALETKASKEPMLNL